MATAKDFFQGARPKTLSAAISPVIIGGSFAVYEIYVNDSKGQSSTLFSGIDITIFIACLVVSLALQVGVNYANDYSDGLKGTDDNRAGPVRLVGQKIASPKSVFRAMVVFFILACVSGIYIASQSNWWLIAVGAVCIALAWFYTGGKYPYGYYGFGEIVVFICFGLVATVGTFFALTNEITTAALISGCIPGLYSVAILLANNIRDIETDKKSGKKTLASRVGIKNARVMFSIAIMGVVISGVILSFQINYLVLFVMYSIITGIFLVKLLYKAILPPQYIPVLVATSQYNIIGAVLISVLVLVGAGKYA